MKYKIEKGFSLIELMIVIAIIGILLAIAIPAYQRYIVKSRRVDVQRVLVENAQTMERYFSANNTYLNSGGTACAVTITDTSYYTFGTSTCTATTFTFTAVPVSSSSQNGDGNQSLDQTGARTGTWSS